MKIHYSGGLVIDNKNSRRTYLPGWACCVTGDRAWEIRNNGSYTTEHAEVTCTACLRIIKRASILGLNSKQGALEK